MRIVASLLLLVSLSASAQNHKATPKPTEAQERLVFTLILSRHGIRPPLTSAETLNARSAEPWPTWEVPLGHLTPHGVLAMQQMARFQHAEFVHNGLLPVDACPAPGDIYLYADTDERNISSTRATFAAMLPGCPQPSVQIMVEQTNGNRDPLFLPMVHTFKAPEAAESLAALTKAMGGDPAKAMSLVQNPALADVARILAPDPDHQPTKPFLNEPVSISANPGGDPLVTAHGPLAAASTLIENILLEYANGKPISDVAWGRADEAAILRLGTLRVKSFALSHRTPYFARYEASDLLSHSLDTLTQFAVDRIATQVEAMFPDKNAKPLPRGFKGAIGPTGTKLVYISGHDTNLVGVAALLDLHWQAVGITDDDTPPDSQIAFELWSAPGSDALNIRAVFRAQTLLQLREASALNASNPPVEVPLALPGCTLIKPCPLKSFLAAAKERLDPNVVAPLVPSRPAP